MAFPREVVSVHLGQAGLQTGHAFWELICNEHGILADGTISESAKDTHEHNTFFHEIPSGQHVPRALLADLEPSVIDEIRTGMYHKLFHPELLYNGKEDAGNNFARGYYTLGKKFLYGMIEKMRMITESCDACQGFMVFNSNGGGTGSGLSALFIDRLKVEFGRKPIIQTSINPGKRLTSSTVEAYNSLLIADRTIDTVDLCTLMENESLYSLCQNKLNIESPSFSDVNRLIAPMITGLTSTMRYGGTLNCSLSEIRTNLVPYPRIHFPIMSYSPLHNFNRIMHEPMTTVDITRELFDKDNYSSSIDCSNGKFMAICLMYRGDNSPCQINDALNLIKMNKASKWVNWCPTGFKIGLTEHYPVHHFELDGPQTDKAVLMIANNTAIGDCMNDTVIKFDRLFKKRAFVHWYVSEGMEEYEFIEARMSLSLLIHDFFEIDEEKTDKQKEDVMITETKIKKFFKPPKWQHKESSTTIVEPFNISEPQDREWNDGQFYEKKVFLFDDDDDDEVVPSTDKKESGGDEYDNKGEVQGRVSGEAGSGINDSNRANYVY